MILFGVVGQLVGGEFAARSKVDASKFGELRDAGRAEAKTAAAMARQGH